MVLVLGEVFICVCIWSPDKLIGAVSKRISIIPDAVAASRGLQNHHSEGRLSFPKKNSNSSEENSEKS